MTDGQGAEFIGPFDRANISHKLGNGANSLLTILCSENSVKYIQKISDSRLLIVLFLTGKNWLAINS